MASYQLGLMIQAAIDLIRRAVAVNPSVPDYHANLGELLRRTGEVDEAVAACCRAVQLNPLSPGAHNNLGVALRDAGRIDDAIAAFGRAAVSCE